MIWAERIYFALLYTLIKADTIYAGIEYSIIINYVTHIILIFEGLVKILGLSHPNCTTAILATILPLYIR